MRRRFGQWTTARRLTAASFLVALVLGGRDWLPFRGSTTATETLGVVPLTDPLAALEFVLATGEPRTEVLIGAVLLVAACALLGPVFCSWACPLGLLLELNDVLRRQVRRLLRVPAVRLPETSLPREIRFLALGSALGFAVFAGLPAFSALSPIHMLSWAAIAGVGTGLVAIAAIAALEWFAPRLWCRSVCPLGALYALVGRYAPLRVRIDPHLAGRTPCTMCSTNCPMGLRVMEEFSLAGATAVDHPDCTRCGSCIDACPSGVLRLGLPRRRDRHPAEPPPTAKRPPSRGASRRASTSTNRRTEVGVS